MAGRTNERGFTLIELLVTVAILMILTGLSMGAFNLYKDRAFRGIEQAALNDAIVALEAGKDDVDSTSPGMVTVDQKSAGPIADATSKVLLPGYVNPKSFHIFVTHDPTCNTAGCLEDYVSARHCDTNTKAVYSKVFRGGSFIDFNAAAGGAC